MSLSKPSAGGGGSGVLKRIYSAWNLLADVTENVGGNPANMLKLLGDDTIFEEVFADSDYFTLDGTLNRYFANKNFSFLIQWGGYISSSASMNDKVYIAGQKEPTNSEITLQYPASINNVLSSESHNRYIDSRYIFQAFLNQFIGFGHNNPTTKALKLSNDAASSPDLSFFVIIDLVSES